jgi:hypothetical protein
MHESAGRQTPAGKRHGNKWLTAMLVEAAGSVGLGLLDAHTRRALPRPRSRLEHPPQQRSPHSSAHRSARTPRANRDRQPRRLTGLFTSSAEHSGAAAACPHTGDSRVCVTHGILVVGWGYGCRLGDVVEVRWWADFARAGRKRLREVWISAIISTETISGATVPDVG